MATKHTPEMRKNHRSRLRKRYAASGAESFDDYLLLELLLFEFIPRVDTYPMAHDLIDTFGNIENVFSAPPDELIKINGIGPKTVEKLILLGDVMNRTVAERLSGDSLLNPSSVSSYLIWTFRSMEVDTACLLLLDSKGRLREKNIFLPCDNKEGSLLAAAEGILKSRYVKYAVLAHKHPTGKCEPSGADISVMNAFNELCEKFGIIPLDHYIVTNISAFPVKIKEAVEEYIK